MSETLKQNRLLRERGDDGSFAHPSDDGKICLDLQSNVSFCYLGSTGPVHFFVFQSAWGEPLVLSFKLYVCKFIFFFFWVILVQSNLVT